MEYKFKLTDSTPERLEELTTQMKYRLNAGVGKSRPHEIEGKYRINEGTGEAFYRIGVEDDGTPTGLNFDYML
jgi:GTPase